MRFTRNAWMMVVVVLAGLLWMGAAPAVKTAATRPAATRPAGKLKGFVWKATSKTTECYLLGSVHLATPDMYPLAPEIEAAFKKSDVLVVEFDITKVDQMALLQMVTESGMYQDGDTLEKHVSPETLKLITDFSASSGLPGSLVSTMKPWMAAITLTALEADKAGLKEELGIDKHFLNAAAGKKIVELESAEFQMKMMSSLPDKEQEAWLATTAKSLGTMGDEIKEMVKIWKTGDGAGMQKMMDKDAGDDAESKAVDKKLVEDRNGPMAEKIEKLMEGKQKVFVVVGAAHLIGEKGILKMLEKKGYKVEQMGLTPQATTQPG